MHPISERIVRATPKPIRGAVLVTIKTIDKSIADRLPGLAGEIAFWILLSLPALLLSVIAAIGAVGEQLGGDWKEQLTARISEAASIALTQSAVEGTVLPLLDQLLDGGGIGVISVAFVAALWTASRAVKVVLQTLAVVARHDPRKGWHDRLIGFGVTLGALVTGIVLTPLLLAGPSFGEQIVDWTGGAAVGIETMWRWLYWPVVVAMATVAITLLYRLAAAGQARLATALPGALLATAVWLIGSAGLRLYGSWFMGSESIYGSLAGPIVALLWLWLTGFAVLLGAELNEVRASLAAHKDGA